MSDFDKEAEREKLREKYADDQQDRESTERMSDLLLKGATMTNAHCGTCGDPIFRHEGQEFCPTCQEVLTEADDAADVPADGEETADRADAPTADPANAATADSEAATNGTASAAGDETANVRSQGHATGTPSGGAGPADDPTATPESEPVAPVETEGVGNATPPAAERGAPRTTGAAVETGGDLASARARLTATIDRLTALAADSDDLERTRAYLGAVEEAADALAAVNRADR
ncbi:Sjogren's syndrome/scleroderma autoantigen 1 family protein [Halorientalis halophila]|uniref:Sjogren's syndrome/scleroderma autoantigen 1 family protein n=1 Tax=Halorientalis halophila TaxID=3108499 RepID=UPI0030088ED3